ncbi:DUF58 domain-containing protein [Deinococcus aquiradiocola]|uniref:DUF58 domain-containing protein n=1 Tax=Deinococcus aquiradiocola TaxID=393059 RepID=A0A917PLJ0_9DEIO|nr:DUF58 domain-containing protein [Deinococcus aquiradiocola]GGJ84007.1 hypothetical protein GCM10008939_29850 [Deinococcus aquiradiocola]
MSALGLGFALLLLLLVWGTWSAWRIPPHVTLRRDLPGQGFADDRVPLTTHLTVRAALPTRVRLEDPAPLTVVPDVPFSAGGLVWGETSTVFPTELTLNRRGVYRWEGARLQWADPFGLFWRSVTLPHPTTLEVYPGTHGLRLPNLLRPLLSEGTLTRTLGLDDPISLRGARPYLPGDPPGRVHWRLSARTGDLMVRELERTASSSLHLHLDTCGSGVYVESAVRLAASLVQEALTLHLPVAVSSGDRAGSSPSGSTPEALRHALRVLAEVRATSGPPAALALPRAGSNLIVVTQSAHPDLLAAAVRARARASRVVIVAVPEGFYLEPGESPRRQWVGLPDTVRELERQAGILAGAGVLVYVLRGDMSVLRLG